MNFVNMDPNNMSEEYKRIFNKNLAIIQCGEDLNSLFKVLSLDYYDQGWRFVNLKNRLANFIVETLTKMKKLKFD